MEYSYLAEQNHGDSGSRAFRYVRAERPQQRLDIRPGNSTARRAGEYPFQRPLVLPLHRCIVPYNSTISIWPGIYGQVLIIAATDTRDVPLEVIDDARIQAKRFSPPGEAASRQRRVIPRSASDEAISLALPNPERRSNRQIQVNCRARLPGS